MQKRRALIVGAGHWSRAWGETLKRSEEVDIVGWVDIRHAAAIDAAQQLGLPPLYTGTDLQEAIAATRPDFVVNVTVPSAHREVAVQALEAGLPVLCEKPLADTMEQAQLMVEASERSGKLLMVSQQRTRDAGFAAMRRLIKEHIGPLGILNSDFYLSHPEPQFHAGMPSPLLLDMAVHTFDAARYLSSADPVAVYCEDFNPPWSWHAGNSSAVAIFEMAGGLRYTYRGSWCCYGRITTWESEWRAVGPNGTVTWQDSTPPEAEVVVEPPVFPARTRRIVGELRSDLPTGIAGSLHDFLHALDTGATPMGECHDNIKSLAMVLGALESAASRRRVQI
jgi:predicted dehydrogenase